MTDLSLQLFILFLFFYRLFGNSHVHHTGIAFNSSRRHHAGIPQKYTLDRLWNISNRQQFIIDTWMVPHAWVNPSIVRHPNDSEVAIMIYRIPDKGKRDKIGHLQFDIPFKKIVKKPDMMELLGPNTSRTMMYGEDARVFVSNGLLYVVYNTHLTKAPKQLYFAEIKHSKAMDNFYVDFPPNHVNIEHEFGVRHQKNWAPFDYKPKGSMKKMAELLFVYSIVPHRVVKAYSTDEAGNMRGHSVALTQLENEYEWLWGELRGGSPAVLVDDEYLVFFHSSGQFNGKNIISYFMGAYAFQRKPPFAITRLSPEPIIAKAFINETISGWAYRKIDYVIFAMGFIDDIEHDRIYVSYGKNDRESWVLELNRTGFLNSLKPVKSVQLGDSEWKDGIPVPGTYKLNEAGVAAAAAADAAAELAADKSASGILGGGR